MKRIGQHVTREMITAYLQSPQWKEKRALRLEKDRNRCRTCGSTRNLEVHHSRGSYALIPNESVDDDLLTLCAECHKAIHEVIDRQIARQRKKKERKNDNRHDIE